MLILIAVVLLSIGQVLFKIAANSLSDIRIETLFNPVLLLALAIYGVATILWIISLRSVPLRLAYPFFGLAFVCVPLMAHLVLSEPLKWSTFIGAAFILVGVWISVALD